MKKLIVIGLAVMLVVGLCAIPVMAAPAGNNNEKSTNVFLYTKNPPADPSAPEWDIDYTGAWGKFEYNITVTDEATKTSEISGNFKGHGLVVGTSYDLISYNDPWAATPQVVVIGTGTADKNGKVWIAIDTPVNLGTDVASPVYDWDGVGDGYKIWLVPTSHLTGTQFNQWDHTAYLFENNRIGATAP